MKDSEEDQGLFPQIHDNCAFILECGFNLFVLYNNFLEVQSQNLEGEGFLMNFFMFIIMFFIFLSCFYHDF